MAALALPKVGRRACCPAASIFYMQKFSKAGKLAFEESTLGLATVEAQECDRE